MTTLPWSFRGHTRRFGGHQDSVAKWADIDPNLRTAKARVCSLRKSLDAAAGGDTPAADDVADVLIRSLRREEEVALLAKLSVKHGAATPAGAASQWAAIGKAFVEVVARQRQCLGMFSALLCIVLRAANIGSKRRIRQNLDIHVPDATWRRTSGQEYVHQVEARSNGRQGYRKIRADDMHNILESNSVDSCTFLKGRKRRRIDGGEGDAGCDRELKVGKQLTDSKAQIFHCSESIWSKIGLSTWYRYFKKDFWQYRVGKRKLDMCKKCMQWDHRIAPSARASLQEWRSKMEHLMPNYWDHWDSVVLPGLGPTAAKDISVEFVEAFLQYIEAQEATRTLSKAKGALKAALALHNAEAEIADELRSKWAKVKGEADVGLLPLVRMHALHFKLRDVQKAHSKEDLHSPASDTLYFWMDFKEHLWGVRLWAVRLWLASLGCSSLGYASRGVRL